MMNLTVGVLCGAVMVLAIRVANLRLKSREADWTLLQVRSEMHTKNLDLYSRIAELEEEIDRLHGDGR